MSGPRGSLDPPSLRKRILVVNCYVDDSRQVVRRTHKVPQPLAPVFLAGACAPERCDVRIHNELYSGPLDPAALAWADMLVMTGLVTSLDRMRQLTAYARTLNPGVVVVAGGHAVRTFPRLCATVFDYGCLGDAEELGEVLTDAFGAAYAAEEIHPRYDLAPWIGRIGYAEASRNCNFRCGFCTLTAEGRRYQPYAHDALAAQLRALGRREFVMFLDNNFSGPDRSELRARLALLRDLHRAGQFQAWGALVTADFLLDEENLALAHDAGCRALFSGVESFDARWLRSVNKAHGAQRDPAELIRRTLEHGIMFSYGLVLDPTTRTLDELRDEIDALLSTPDITLPAYTCVTIPFPGTPFFERLRASGGLLPRTRVRDLEGSTLSVRPLEPVEDVVAFLRSLRGMRGYRTRVARQTARFVRRYRRRLSAPQLAIAAMHGVLLGMPNLATAPWRWGRTHESRTHLSTTEMLDAVYRPSRPVDAKYEALFRPVTITDARGELTEDVAPDLAGPVARVAARVP